MVYEKSASCRWVGRWFERALERLKYIRDVFVKISDFSGHRADNFGLIRRKMLKLLSPLGMLDLEGVNTIIILVEENESLTSLLPKSPYIWNSSMTQVAEIFSLVCASAVQGDRVRS
jgi:hypothetical protein